MIGSKAAGRKGVWAAGGFFMKQFHFKYGEGGVDLALPETGRLQVLAGRIPRARGACAK